MKSKNPVVWFEIYVDDMERAKKFYEKVLDIQLSDLPVPAESSADDSMKMMAFPMEMDGAGAAGAIVKVKGMKAGGNGTLVYFRSDDCSVEQARIKDAGGNVIQSKQSLGEYGFMVLATDTEGNMFGVHSQG